MNLIYETSFVRLAKKLSQVTVNFIVNLYLTYESRDTQNYRETESGTLR